ncbi:MAG: GNAT family N-acetyltransferase [Prevotellaceae bacterium]|jgi:hypothetical protein|nr:GNAT family N-acetyltransferase [Prevotellaceae bacterium]
MSTINSWSLLRYAPDKRDAWNAFVQKSKNGTFLLNRNYMDYHADRFCDYSLMIYRNRQLMALLPGNLAGGCFCSHEGLTYGGLILAPSATLANTEQALGMSLDYLRDTEHVTSFTYRSIPHIYHRYPAEEDLYVLSRLGATLKTRSLSSVVPTGNRLPFRTLRRRQSKRAFGHNLTFVNDTLFAPFWKILEDNLRTRYGVAPVHTLEEITRLQRCFPDNISLYRVCTDTEETVGGCVVYETDRVAHVQYIASSPVGRRCGALDLLFDHLIHVRYAGRPYFDFGISTEQGGQVLNEGLLFQKEGFGGRAVLYDTYELLL